MANEGSFDARILGVQVTLRSHDFRSSEQRLTKLFQLVGAHNFGTSVNAAKSAIDNKIYV
jgi:hypothetical protein